MVSASLPAAANGATASSSNPIANPDQFAAEELVRRLWATDRIKQARRIVAQNFAIAHGAEVPDEAKSTFEGAIDEFVVNYLFKAAAYDPSHPRIVRLFMHGYRWADRDVPSARMGGDNPDNVYRVAGIGHGHRYVLKGKPAGPVAPSISLTLVANWGTSMTVQTLMYDELDLAADGSFEITIDDQPANGRKNHMTTVEDVRFLFVRDSLSDWARQSPLDLQIQCLDPGPTALTEEQLATEAAKRMIEEVPLYFWFSRMFSALKPNTLLVPDGRAAFGGLVRQTSSRGNIVLADDEAFVATYDPAGAHYSAVALHDWWFRSIDAHRILSSTTTDMAVRNGDGTVTVVVAPHDPGVANWIDTNGLHHVQFLVRWQGVDRVPTIRGTVVKVANLDPALPRVTVAQRAAEVAARRAAADRRTTV
ncbi:DUF1214 domain-containing protein [Sphingobium sp.]|uniref:DUF1214 domain-containing protein n=1 Tax=Sphingobium sp. TaxID=1912891 RepID=UPI0028BE1876|nr:DUF1214 domain-containing protein [Sphingobium sp.]